MAVKRQQAFLHARKQLAKCHARRQFGSQNVGVKKKAENRLQFLTIPVGERDSERDVFASC